MVNLDLNSTYFVNSSSVMMTSMPTLAPTINDTLPCGNPPGIGCSSVTNNEMRTGISIGMVIVFCLPFCIIQKVCWRRIKERRWISSEGEEEDQYPAFIRRQLERRKQRMEAHQRRCQTNRTKHDEIREQHLLQCMKNYTMVRLWMNCNEQRLHTSMIISHATIAVSSLLFKFHSILLLTDIVRVGHS
jgi:hypothetical protein